MQGNTIRSLGGFLRKFDWILFGAVFLLVAIGLITIYSVEIGRESAELVNLKKQLLAGAIGIILLIVFATVHPLFFRATSKWLYLLGIVLLLLLFFFGTTVRGTRGWFIFSGFSFQPVEFVKLAVLLLLSAFTAGSGRVYYHWSFFVGSLLLTAVPMIFVLAQPDFGSALLIGALWFTLMLTVRTKRSHLSIFLLLLVFIFGLGWMFFFKEYQKDRIRTFLNPASDPLGSGYNITQSVIAIGAGQWVGRGLGFGSQSQLKFLPESHTDFIFAVIAEELGFLGVLVLLGLYGVILYRLFFLARRVQNDFLLCTLLLTAFLFFTELLVNVGMNLGMLPVTGVTLPFVSYGGSSLVIHLVLIGIAEGIALRFENKTV